MINHDNIGDIMKGLQDHTWIVPHKYIDILKENSQLKEKIVQLETLYANARDRIADLEQQATMSQIVTRQLEEENAKLREDLNHMLKRANI